MHYSYIYNTNLSITHPRTAIHSQFNTKVLNFSPCSPHRIIPAIPIGQNYTHSENDTHQNLVSIVYEHGYLQLVISNLTEQHSSV